MRSAKRRIVLDGAGPQGRAPARNQNARRTWIWIDLAKPPTDVIVPKLMLPMVVFRRVEQRIFDEIR